MPFIGFLIFLILATALLVSTIRNLLGFIKTKDRSHVKRLVLIWILPAILIGFISYSHFPITKERIVGTYKIDHSFYPGRNADWQRDLFYFEITENDDFLFHEKLKDGSYKTIKGKISWFRNSPPMLFRINLKEEHPLIDELPALYRGGRKFYYVFESKFGNMFYRKTTEQ